MSKKHTSPKRAYSVHTGLKFAVFVDTAGHYRWNLLARNGKIIADSGESYVKESDARAMIDLIIGASKFARILATRPLKLKTPVIVTVPDPTSPTPPGAIPVERPFTGNPSPGG